MNILEKGSNQEILLIGDILVWTRSVLTKSQIEFAWTSLNSFKLKTITTRIKHLSEVGLKFQVPNMLVRSYVWPGQTSTASSAL